MRQIENHRATIDKPIVNDVSVHVPAVEAQKLLGISLEGSVR